MLLSATTKYTAMRMALLEESLEKENVLSRHTSLDVYVSLHRSEGIALGFMEAMQWVNP
jgi:hypothetical protein